MSISVMSLVWDTNLPPQEKLVLLAYADRADDEGENIFPAIPTIARKTGYTDRNVQAGQFEVDLANGAPWGDSRAIEFHHRDFNHYFVSSNLDEIAGLDAGVFYGWTRTGEDFRVGIPDARGRGFLPVCRFFGVGFAPLSSHFYTPYPNECDVVDADPKWLFEKIAFGLALPDAATHGCPPGTRPLYRLWNRSQDGAPNHRYTTSTLTFDEMIGEGWIFEGEKETRVFACVPN